MPHVSPPPSPHSGAHGLDGLSRTYDNGPVEPMARALAEAEEEVIRLVDEYRTRCLWFLRPDYYPTSDDDRLRVLRYIERHGDRRAFQRAAAVRQWLSRNSSARSAAS